MRAESPKSSIAQGNALGIRYLPTMRPARATLIFHYFLQLPLQGALIVCIRLPRALPWAMEVIGLSAHFVLLLPNPPIESRSYIKINSSIPKRLLLTFKATNVAELKESFWFSHTKKTTETEITSVSVRSCFSLLKN